MVVILDLMLWGADKSKIVERLRPFDTGPRGSNQSCPSRVALSADVPQPTADVAKADVVVGVGDAETTSRARVAERARPESGHARRGELVADAEANVRSGGPALDQRLEIVGSRAGYGHASLVGDKAHPANGPEQRGIHLANARAFVIAPTAGRSAI